MQIYTVLWSDGKNLVSIKVFTIQRDEDDILEDWLRYHIYLFGKENIYVIDHKSKKSRKTINKYNVNLIPYEGPFEDNGKAKILTKTIHKYKDNSKLVIPIDIDEFIVYIKKDNIICDKAKVIRELMQYTYTNKFDSFKFKSLTINSTIHSDLLINCDSYEQENKNQFSRWKSFYKTNIFKQADQGNHGLYKHEYHKTNMGLLHFHHRGFDHFKRKHFRWQDTYAKSTKQIGGTHWKKVFDMIKNKTDEEIKQIWLRTVKDCNNCQNNHLLSFHKKIKELRNLL